MNKLIIRRLALTNYTRMNLFGKTKFVFTPDDTYMLQKIIGTNGSGKSSLLNELWPLPANKKDYGVGGKKELEVSYNGQEYRLVSTFGEKDNHEFWCGLDNLNDSGKIGMFEALAQEHFGVTNEIRGLILEREKLTEMSPARRRYWMVKLADSDFTYAIKAYNHLKDRHRDAQGAIRRLQERLVNEKLKLIDPEVGAGIVREVTDIKELIHHMHDLKSTSKKPEEFKKLLGENGDLIDSLGYQIDKTNIEFLNASGYESAEQMKERRDQIKAEVFSLQQFNQHLFKQHEVIRKKYDVLIKAGTDSLSELEGKLKTAKENLLYSESFVALINVKVEGDPQQMKDALDYIYSDLNDQISSLPKNDGIYTRSKAQEYEDRVTVLSGLIRTLEGRISRLEGELAHRQDHVQAEAVSCPACHHTWTIRASQADIDKAEEGLRTMKDTVAEHLQEMEKAKLYLKEFSEYSAQYRLVMATMRSNSILANYFNEITQSNRLMHYPGSVAAELYTMKSDLVHQVDIHKYRTTIKTIEGQMELKRNLDSNTLEEIEKEMNGLEAAMNAQNVKTLAFQSEYTNLSNLINTHATTVSLHGRIMNAAEETKGLVNLYVFSRYQELLSHLTLSLQTQLARKEDALAAITAQENAVLDVEAQLIEAFMNERVAKMAHVALSPSTGAIAEGLLRFVNIFTAKMNKVINTVWSYPLELLPFEFSEGQVEMDYKFPFQRNRSGKVSDDVVEGSLSMTHIFDFAFRWCAAQLLGFGHLPLFLDEFESSFDDVHRENAIHLVKKCMEDETFGQIFMVSHYEALHGSLSSQSQTCVINAENLILSSDMVVNQHVTMT